MNEYLKQAMRQMATEQLGQMAIAVRDEPIIVRKHVDGPYLLKLDRSMRWLTLWERFAVRLGLHDAWSLEAKDWKLI